MPKVIKENSSNICIQEVLRRTSLNFTDIINNNNKYYNLELVKDNKGEFFLFTTYGRVGGTPAKEFRPCTSQPDAEKNFEKILKEKTKKGYVEVKLVKAEVGSDVAKAKIETDKVSVESLEKLGVKIKEENPSSLHPEVQSLIRTWFGVTADFVEASLDTAKCPLGQLSVDQINKGKEILEDARKIIHSSSIDLNELNKLTSLYYSNIPHNFGYRRINPDELRFDQDNKIDKALDILDVFTDAKNVENLFTRKSNVDAQYATLNADLQYLNPEDPTWIWIDKMLHQTRANNHDFLGKLKTHKIYKISRKNEEKYFLSTAEKIAKECGKFNPSKVYASLVKERPDISSDLKDLYNKANICPGWHGTRRANMIGITTKGLLIRPSGVIHAGSMYGDGIYWASNSSKSINYCDVKGSYWAQGNNKTAWLFLADVCLGSQKIANGSCFYTQSNIKPNHSVWAVGGKSGVMNDEFITYTASGYNQQHILKYIIEFETLVK